MSKALTPSQRRGAAPVGHLAELPAAERGAVLFLRLWCEGASGREAMAEDFCRCFGLEEGHRLIAAQDQLMHLLLGQSRRPLMRHSDGCTCVGADESAFAQMVAASASGDREDATLFGMILMQAHAVPLAMEEAEHLGHAYATLFDPLSRKFGQGFSPIHLRRH